MVLEIFCTLGENFWTLRELDHDTPLADMFHNVSIFTMALEDISKCEGSLPISSSFIWACTKL